MAAPGSSVVIRSAPPFSRDEVRAILDQVIHACNDCNQPFEEFKGL